MSATEQFLSGFKRMRAGLLPPQAARTSAHTLTAEEARTLREVATSEAPNFLFPRELERHFQSHIRIANRLPRVVLSLLTFVTFITMPAWMPMVLVLPPDLSQLITLMQVGILAPLFALVAWSQLRHPASNWSEALFLGAFILEIVAAEIFRYASEISGAPTEPLMSICIPVAVLTLARLPILSSVVFVIAYFSIIGFGGQLWPDRLGRELPTTWGLEILVVVMTLLSAVWSRLSFRRQWAANVLTEIMAYRDPLTGLANRRAFEDHYHATLAEAARGHKRHLLVALLDLDHFKKLNDIHGHEYGDGALMETALELSQFVLPPNEMAARLGGEEFALLLYDCDREAAQRRLADLMQRMRNLRIPHSGSAQGILTCSIGAAMVRLDQPMSESYREADEMLYRVKHAGRNNFALAD